MTPPNDPLTRFWNDAWNSGFSSCAAYACIVAAIIMAAFVGVFFLGRWSAT